MMMHKTTVYLCYGETYKMYLHSMETFKIRIMYTQFLRNLNNLNKKIKEYTIKSELNQLLKFLRLDQQQMFRRKE